MVAFSVLTANFTSSLTHEIEEDLNLFGRTVSKSGTDLRLKPVLLVFSVTPFKIDQNKNQNRSIDNVQNLGNERRYINKDPRQDSGQRNISYTRYPKKCFTQTYRDLYGDAMLVLTWMSSNMADEKPTETSVSEFCYKSVNLFFEELINIKVILFLIHELFRQQNSLK